MELRIWVRMGLMRSTRFGHALRFGAPLLLVLLMAACATGGTTRSNTPTPTATVAGDKQDIIPTPSTTPISPTATPRSNPTPPPVKAPAAPSADGRVILVSLSQQRLYAYDNGALSFTFLVETGRPELPTPTGVYHIFSKNCSDRTWTTNLLPTFAHNKGCAEHNGDGYKEMFTSPWPAGSPYWYAPTHINYAMQFRDGGYFLHDAWWHEQFGPGSNIPHKLSNGEWETGSHGCVGMPTASAEKLYLWAPIGTAVYIRWNA